MEDHSDSVHGAASTRSDSTHSDQYEGPIRDNDSTMGDSLHAGDAPSDEVDVSDVEDNDSTMGDSVASSTVSLTSSVAQYEYEHGRRYHAYRAGQYYQPNDEQEQHLMETAHLISLETHDYKLFFAPLEEPPTSILDIGTGTGAWAIDVADEFPEATVIGTDLSPIQPSWVPPNLQFEVSDCESEWTFSTQFDLIHMRNMSSAISDWPRLLSQAQSQLRRRGWLDIANLNLWLESNNNALPADSALAQWRKLLFEAARQVERDIRAAERVRQWLIDAGYVNVTEEVFKIPLSPWMRDDKWKRIAELMQYLFKRQLEGVSLALFTRVLNWSAEDLRSLLSRVRADMFNINYEMYCNVHYVWGQKPGDSSTDPA